jgi:hypothetical protein
MNLPPGFKTLKAYDKATLVLGTFLKPNEIVYASKVFDSKGNYSALAQMN